MTLRTQLNLLLLFIYFTSSLAHDQNHLKAEQTELIQLQVPKNPILDDSSAHTNILNNLMQLLQKMPYKGVIEKYLLIQYVIPTILGFFLILLYPILKPWIMLVYKRFTGQESDEAGGDNLEEQQALVGNDNREIRIQGRVIKKPKAKLQYQSFFQ